MQNRISFQSHFKALGLYILRVGIGSKGSYMGKVIHMWVRERGGALVLNIIYYILLTIFVLFWLGLHLG